MQVLRFVGVDAGTELRDRLQYVRLGLAASTLVGRGIEQRSRQVSDAFVEILESLGIDYEIVACDPALADTAQFCDAYGYALEDSANTIVVAGKSDPPVYVACVVLATTRLDVNKTVRKRMGVRGASFARSADVERLTGMTIGGVTPIGLPSDLPLWVDSRVMERRQIILGGGSRSRKVLASPEVLIALGGVVVEGLARAPS